MSINSQQNLAISDLFSGDVNLSSPPNIYFELQKVIDDINKKVSDAAKIIEKDVALSAKLLKIVNSAFYGFPSKIVSIDRAINLIGSKELQNIALSTIVIDRFSNLPGNFISMHDFWARSLRCALIAQGIDSFLGNSFAESAFICGILHNIGQLVIFRRLPELSREIGFKMQAEQVTTQMTEINIEKRVIGFDHFQVGAELSHLWKLPEIISETIRLHAYPDNTDSYHRIASIIRLADSYSKIENELTDNVTNDLGISAQNMTIILDQSQQEFDVIFQVFYP